jgi:multidrug transporter EmrE-like cation transporter
MGYVFLVIAFTLNASANVFLKTGAQKLEEMSASALLTNYALLAGLTLFGLNVVFYALALKNLPLSISYPVMVAGSLVLVTFGSVFYVGETITLTQALGMVLLLIAVVLIVK